ncbi:MAG: nuclease-related domain-containing protein [Promethearchaeota archaeon]
MVQIFGTSQSTKALQYQLPTLNGYEFSSWKDIKKFYTLFPKFLEQRIEEITQDLEDKKPFKKKDSKRKKKKVQVMINRRLKPYHEAYKVLANNQEAFAGAMGEEAVISVLSKLNDSYYVFNDITLALPQTIFWKKHQEYIRSAQIDHLVIGPSGIFIIETKNWKPGTLKQTKFLPHFQVARAGFIFSQLTKRKFGSLPVYNTVVTLATLPQVKYPGVDQITIRQLTPHVLRRTKKLDTKKIEKIASWLIKYA